MKDLNSVLAKMPDVKGTPKKLQPYLLPNTLKSLREGEVGFMCESPVHLVGTSDKTSPEDVLQEWPELASASRSTPPIVFDSPVLQEKDLEKASIFQEIKTITKKARNISRLKVAFVAFMSSREQSE